MCGGTESATRTAQEYHTAADRLQLIPASAKRAGGVQFEIALDRAGASAAEIVSVDVKARPPRSAPPLWRAGSPNTLRNHCIGGALGRMARTLRQHGLCARTGVLGSGVCLHIRVATRRRLRARGRGDSRAARGADAARAARRAW